MFNDVSRHYEYSNSCRMSPNILAAEKIIRKVKQYMSHANFNPGRRRFFGAAAITIATAPLSVSGCGQAILSASAAATQPTIKAGTHTSFGPLKQIDAGLLNVGYAEAGPADGPAVILLHGWPYDIHSLCRCRTVAWHRQATG